MRSNGFYLFEYREQTDCVQSQHKCRTIYSHYITHSRWVYRKWHIIWHKNVILYRYIGMHKNKNVCYYGVIALGLFWCARSKNGFFVNVLLPYYIHDKKFFWFYLSKYNKLEPTDARANWAIQKDVYGIHKYFGCFFFYMLKTVTHFVFMWSLSLTLPRSPLYDLCVCRHTACIRNILSIRKIYARSIKTIAIFGYQ